MSRMSASSGAGIDPPADEKSLNRVNGCSKLSSGLTVFVYFTLTVIDSRLSAARSVPASTAAGAMLYPVMRPSKIASPSLVTWLRLDWLRLRSLSASVNVWLSVGLNIGSVLDRKGVVWGKSGLVRIDNGG